MENRGGYGYGIRILLTPKSHVPFDMYHKFHITLISNINCKRKAQNIFQKLLNINIIDKLPRTLSEEHDYEIMKFEGHPYSALGWKVKIENWNEIKKIMSDSYNNGNIPVIPHISLQYYNSIDFEICDRFMKNIEFTTSLVLADMNDSNPSNWKCGLNF